MIDPACTRASHDALKTDAATFAAGTKYVGPCPEGVMANCLRCLSTLVLDLGPDDPTYPDTRQIERALT